AAVHLSRVRESAGAKPLGSLRVGGARDHERDVVDVADIGRVRRAIRLPGLAREDRDEPAIARIEVEVVLVRRVGVRLLENERHAEHALPEVDGRLTVSTNQSNVMHALTLHALHGCRSAARTSTSLPGSDPEDGYSSRWRCRADRPRTRARGVARARRGPLA